MFLAIWLVRDLAATRPLPSPVARKAASVAGTEDAAPENAAQDRLTAYNVIVAKYLFSPSRTEGAPEVAKPVVPLPPKPILLGVVVDGPASRAYLEDPSTKRVFGYQVGDSVAGRQAGEDHGRPHSDLPLRWRDGRHAPRPEQASTARAGPGGSARRARRTAPGACGQSSRGAARCARAPAHSATVAPPSACRAVVIGSVAALAHFGSRKPIAFAQALLMLSLCACSSTKAAKTPPLPTDYKMTVKTEDAPPAAPTPPPAQKPEPAPAPAVKAPPAPAPGPVVVIPAPSATPPPGSDKSPKAIAGATSDPAAAAPDRGTQPVVRIRQAQAAPAGQPTPQSPGRLVVFNFDNADIEIVLQATSELLVFNYVLAPGARGKKVTVQTTGRIPVDDIFPVLLTILDVNGLAAVKSGNVWRIIPKEGAVQTSTRTIVGPQLDPGVPGDEVITQLIPLQFTSATDVLNLLRPFVPPQGSITATRDTNLLVVTDAAANIRRLLDILKLVDVDVALNELQILPLKNADAQEVAQILTQLFASGRFRPSGAQLPAGIAPPVAPPGAPGAPPPPEVSRRRVRTRAPPIALRSSCRSGGRTPSSSTRANRRWKPSLASSRSSTRTSTAGNASSSTSPRTPRRRISRPRSTPSSGAARDRPPPRAPRLRRPGRRRRARRACRASRASRDHGPRPSARRAAPVGARASSRTAARSERLASSPTR